MNFLFQILGNDTPAIFVTRSSLVLVKQGGFSEPPIRWNKLKQMSRYKKSVRMQLYFGKLEYVLLDPKSSSDNPTIDTHIIEDVLSELKTCVEPDQFMRTLLNIQAQFDPSVTNYNVLLSEGQLTYALDVLKKVKEIGLGLMSDSERLYAESKIL